MLFLTPEQVEALAKSIASPYGTLIRVAATFTKVVRPSPLPAKPHQPIAHIVT